MTITPIQGTVAPVMSRRSDRLWIGSIAVALAAIAMWSALCGGVIHMLYTAAIQGQFVATLRGYILDLGAAGAVAYVGVVIVEVVITPIPAALVYAPGGAIFGGFWGGTLSLVGNVIGAVIACLIGRAFGEEWLNRRSERTALRRLQARLREKSIVVIVLLRLNPLTTTDLVSYVAGIAGVPPTKVAVGTALGLAPLCYLQSYLAEAFLEFVPSWAIIVFGALLVITVLGLFFRR